MPIEFNCTQCGNPMAAADEHAGRQFKCPNCGTVVTAPVGAAPPVAPAMTPEMLAYSGQRPDGQSKGWAIATLVVGIFSICLPFLIPVAIILGIVALVKSSNSPGQYGGKGMAIGGMVVSFAGVPVILLVSILLPSLARARELSKRTVCAANLKGIAVGLYTYGNENGDDWPIAAHIAATRAGVGETDYTRAIGSYRSVEVAELAEAPARLSTTRNLWTLIRTNASTPKSFVCPSSGDMPNNDDDPTQFHDFGEGDIDGEVSPIDVAGFYQQCSYGYQVPYGRHGRPGSMRDARMVLMADKGPFGAAIDGGQATPPSLSTAGLGEWRPWNSPNHGGQGDGEGQNVAMTDGHVEFLNSPRGGVKDDNIYTRWTGPAPDGSPGVAPTTGGMETPFGDTDTLIYP